jgi:hypothetical protein
MGRKGKAWHSMAWNDKARHGKVRQGMKWHGMAMQGKEKTLHWMEKKIVILKLSHMFLEKSFFIYWDKKCSFFVILVSLQSTF